MLRARHIVAFSCDVAAVMIRSISPRRNSSPIDDSFFVGPTTCQIKSRLIHIMTHSSKVKANPPTRLRWYFQDADAREYMLKVLVANGVESVVQP